MGDCAPLFIPDPPGLCGTIRRGPDVGDIARGICNTWAVLDASTLGDIPVGDNNPGALETCPCAAMSKVCGIPGMFTIGDRFGTFPNVGDETNIVGDP